MKKGFALAVWVLGVASAMAAPVAVNSYTFLGRITDSSHAAFDTNRVATVKALRKSSSDLIARTTTYFRSDSRRNYTLMIPMSSEPASGYAVKGQPLDISVVDDTGFEWTGVILDATAEAPDRVREVDIVLGIDKDGDGIDDDLYAQLEAQWEKSDYYVDGEDFDPKKDHDGDGVSTIDEALSGTNPYNPEDVLKITSFTLGEQISLEFNGANGHSYVVEGVESLGSNDWRPLNVISLPNNPESTVCTIYLLPSESNAAFFRVRAE